MDFYYQSLVIYFIFFLVYALIKGNFFEQKFQLVFNDPIIYMLMLFIVIFLVIVIVNIIRSKQIILKEDKIIFKNRFGERSVSYKDIMNVRIIKKRIAKEDMPFRIIKLRLKNRRRLLRIRANDYERGPELIREFLKLKPAH